MRGGGQKFSKSCQRSLWMPPAWNGLMISGFSISGMALQKPQYVERAIKAALFLKQHLYDSQSNVRTVLRFSEYYDEVLN